MPCTPPWCGTWSGRRPPKVTSGTPCCPGCGRRTCVASRACPTLSRARSRVPPLPISNTQTGPVPIVHRTEDPEGVWYVSTEGTGRGPVPRIVVRGPPPPAEQPAGTVRLPSPGTEAAAHRATALPVHQHPGGARVPGSGGRVLDVQQRVPGPQPRGQQRRLPPGAHPLSHPNQRQTGAGGCAPSPSSRRPHGLARRLARCEPHLDATGVVDGRGPRTTAPVALRSCRPRAR